MSTPKADRTIDVRGSFCPGPLMELIKGIKEAKVSEVLAVYSSDTGSKRDIPLWVNKAKHDLIAIVDHDGFTEFVIRKSH